jgi:hypothetical protein
VFSLQQRWCRRCFMQTRYSDGLSSLQQTLMIQTLMYFTYSHRTVFVAPQHESTVCVYRTTSLLQKHDAQANMHDAVKHTADSVNKMERNRAHITRIGKDCYNRQHSIHATGPAEITRIEILITLYTSKQKLPCILVLLAPTT